MMRTEVRGVRRSWPSTAMNCSRYWPMCCELSSSAMVSCSRASAASWSEMSSEKCRIMSMTFGCFTRRASGPGRRGCRRLAVGVEERHGM
jgi:hypothetical protein